MFFKNVFKAAVFSLILKSLIILAFAVLIGEGNILFTIHFYIQKNTRIDTDPILIGLAQSYRSPLK